MSWYEQSKSPAVLFVHTDKNIYAPTEAVWFKGYLLKGGVEIEKHHTLSVALIRMEDRKVCLQRKFLMQQGLCAGDLVLPDSLQGGRYTFLAYTNIMLNGVPLALFTQPLEVRTTPQASEYLLSEDSAMKGTDFIKLHLVSTKGPFAKKAQIDVSYLNKEREVRIPASVSKMSNEEAIVTLPRPEVADRHLNIAVRDGVRESTLTYDVPTDKPFFDVRFYPEGGHLVNDLSSLVGWEVKDREGNPIAVKGMLFEENQLLDTIKTDLTGMGAFILTPRAGKRYLVKLFGKGSSDSMNALPPALSSGLVIKLSSALAEDSLKFNVESRQEGSYYVLLHNFKQLFKVFVLHAKTSPSSLSMPLGQIPRGLLTMTVLDPLNRPLAERLLFAHLASRPILRSYTDSTVYHTRSKVKLHLRLQNGSKTPLQGIVSVACVQKNRISPALFRSIENYAYIEHELGQHLGAVELNTEGSQNRAYLENMLLIKGWTRYNWQNLLAASAGDGAGAVTSFNIRGDVNKNGKPVKKPADVYLMNDTLFKLISTTPTGHFELAPENLIVGQGRKINLFLNRKMQGLYQIHLEDPYILLNETLARQLSWRAAPVMTKQPIDQNYLPEVTGKYKLLERVVVKAKTKDQEFYDEQFYRHPLNKIHEGKCTDYVCYLRVLNCPNHLKGTPPIDGELYAVYGLAGALELMVYHGNCKLPPVENIVYSLDGLTQNREIYSFNFSEVPQTEPLYISTLYWNASVMVDNAGEATLSFYTSDIPATFKIIVQGRTGNDVLRGEASFIVTDKNNE